MTSASSWCVVQSDIMTALQLIDSLLYTVAVGEPPEADSEVRLRRLADLLVGSALRAYADVRAIDDCVSHPDAVTAVFDPKAPAVRAMYEEWALGAQALLARATKLKGRGVTVADAQELADAVGRTLAMLKISPEDVEIGRRQVREGRTYSREQIRAELGLGAK
jgi:hypothetical protein